MKNFFKRFITCGVAACLIAVAALAGACTNDNKKPVDNTHTDPTKSGYSITVLYPDGSPVKGQDSPNNPKQKVGVQLVDSQGNDINGAYSVLNDYGKATIPYKQSGEFLIDVFPCPRGFAYNDKVTTVAGRGDYTLYLTAEKVDYTIIVKLPDGSPAIGIEVTVKKNGETIRTATTGTDGKIVIENIDAGTYDLDFANLPKGVSYLPTQLTPNTATLNVELISSIELPLDEVMSEEKLKEWDDLANYYAENDNESDIIRFDRTADCYDFTTGLISEGKKIYYYFTADQDGTYHFISKSRYYIGEDDGKPVYTIKPYTVDFYGSTLGEPWHTTSVTSESTNTCEMVELSLKKGEKYYFSYSIPERIDQSDGSPLSDTLEFMIAKPVAGTKTHEVNGAGNYTIDFETDTAILVFNTPENVTPGSPLPTEGGVFEIRSNTDLYDVKIEFYAYFSGKNQKPDEVEDDISETDKNFLFTLKVPPSFAGNKYYFKIIIKDSLDGSEVEYPTQIPITITRTGNAEENVSPVEYKHATVTEKYSDQSGKTFHFLLGSSNSLDEDSFTIVPKNGGYYVNVDGTEYELVIAIKKNICSLPYSFATIEYMGGGDRGGGSGSDELPSVPSETKQNNYLTLYTNPAVGEDKTNPKLNYAPFIEEYSSLCNSDGVYKLNDELKRFAEMYYGQHSQDFIYGLTLTECCWLIFCGYYA